ncbi:MAG TPA: 3-oxoacyl-ACP reductase FabG [Candidatus Sulfotelmatobacter sp.]|nr:3-oxoacyl-ACP reductase FabG [Candidatus Sulfotelmatobacter sp.]
MKPSGLAGKTVVITGAAAGIGRATALRFASEGCLVAAWDVNDEGKDALLQELTSSGGEGLFRKTNVCDASDVDAAVQEVVARWGSVDVLINNAGITRDSQLVKWKDGAMAGTMTDDAFDLVVSVNLRGVFVCSRAVVPHMIRKGAGVILNASSVVGLYGNFGQTNYAATKAGVIAFAQTWSRELAKYNIRVNAVAPGFIATEMVQKMPEKVVQTMMSHTPLGRIGKPEDVAEAYVWLASDAASFITGTVLSVDGGLVLGT